MSVHSYKQTADDCAVRVVDHQRVRAVSAAMPGAETIDELAQVFGLLADPGRLRVITALFKGGEMCVCDIAAAVGHSESAVSHALRLLRAHRVVRVRRSGRMAYYRLDDSHVRTLLDVALDHMVHDGMTHGEGVRDEIGQARTVRAGDA
jgi:DNA-binding transcriptional ArsR family regulator